MGLPDDAIPDVEIGAGAVVVRSCFGTSGLLDQSGQRKASVRSVGPGVSLRYPRAAVPRLARRLAPGRHLMTCLVLAAGPRRAFDERDPWHDPPEPPGQLVALADARGASFLEVITAPVVRGVAGISRGPVMDTRRARRPNPRAAQPPSRPPPPSPGTRDRA